MNTILMLVLRRNVTKQNYESYFEVMNPFLQTKGFNLVSKDPNIYIHDSTTTESLVRDIGNKLKNHQNYNQVIKSIHTGRLHKI